MWKWVFNLNLNDIEMFVGFRFEGYLDMLKLLGNGLFFFSLFMFFGLLGF